MVDRMSSVTTERAFALPDGQDITFAGISTIASVLLWLKYPFTDSLLQESWSNGAPISPAIDKHFIGSYNRLIGGLRIRQVRVKSDTNCEIDPTFTSIISHCYPELYVVSARIGIVMF